MIVPSWPVMSNASLQTRCESVVVKSLYCDDWIDGGLPPSFAAHRKRVLNPFATAVSVTMCAIVRRTFGSSLSGLSSRFVCFTQSTSTSVRPAIGESVNIVKRSRSSASEII